MNIILKSYFNRLNELSKDKLTYYYYDRDEGSSMPYSVHLCFEGLDGKVQNAWGSGTSRDEALGKGLMELIERITFRGRSPIYYKSFFSFFPKREKSLFELSKKYNLPIKFLHPSNTNGIAIHVSTRKAKMRALFELIERHSILYCILKNIPPHGSLKLNIGDKDCRFFFWNTPRKTKTVVGSVEVGDGFYYSSGSGYSLSVAIERAKLELNSFIYLENNNKADFISDYKIIADDIDSFNRYHRYSGDQSANIFLNNSSNIKLPNLKKSDFYYTEIPQPDVFHGLFKFPCFRVIHPDVQQLFFDNWAFDKINPRLLKQDDELPLFPHIVA